MHTYNDVYKNLCMDELIKCEQGDIRDRLLSNGWGRLDQGNKHGLISTDTVECIYLFEVPTDREVTYVSFVCYHWLLKIKLWRVRLLVGGNRLPYVTDTGSSTSNLILTKNLLNSTISDAGTSFLSCDLKDFFLDAPIDRPEYIKIPIQYFPDNIIFEYNLDKPMHPSDHVYVRIKKSMYGLK